MAHRYFTQEISGDTARITGGDAAHLARVLRVKPGDALLLCDGAGFDYEAEVLAAGDAEVTARLLQKRPTTAEPDIWAEAYIGMAKGERMEYAVQKAVELGASAIVPFYSAHSVVKPKKDEEKAARWQRIATEAAKQCGRGILPAVAAPVQYAAMLAMAAGCNKALFFYEEGGAPLAATVQGLQGGQKIALITGPEGGFSAGEAAQAANAGCITVGLGPRILRCETAPAAALAAVMLITGNLE